MKLRNDVGTQKTSLDDTELSEYNQAVILTTGVSFLALYIQAEAACKWPHHQYAGRVCIDGG